MIKEGPAARRDLKTVEIESDLVIVGGGLAGVCCAITAARAGLRVTLVHDRPVLGGNASSEIRLWALGATCHMESNNRFAREGGVINEILVENHWRNPEGNPVVFDSVVLEFAGNEPNLTVLLNTAAFEVQKAACSFDASGAGKDRISAVKAFCSQNSTMYICRSGLFVDSSGDGVLAFLAGAAFRMGAETKEEFDEPFAPTGEFGYLLGDSLYFQSRDVGHPVTYVPPAFALKNVPERIPRYRQFNARESGCHLWWIEWGGRLDTVHETETIKWKLWEVVYGVWDYIKNSGKFPEAANLSLEWVGMIPGKRESRRFEGPYMLRQRDIVHRPHHADAVAFGGWSIDLHPADGVFSNLAGSHHLHSKGIYQIPYRCLFSRNISNLFLAGRLISATHVAFGSIRVMATCAHGGQAVGMAAALCKESGCLPGDLLEAERMGLLQRRLMQTGQHIPGHTLDDPDDLARRAKISASSKLVLNDLPPDGPAISARAGLAQLLPVSAGRVPVAELLLDVEADTSLEVELRTTSRSDHYTPDVVLGTKTMRLKAGKMIPLAIDFAAEVRSAQYIFLILRPNEQVLVRCTSRRITGLLTCAFRRKAALSDVGGEDFELWRTIRRPEGRNFAMRLTPGIDLFGPQMLTNGLQRPTNQPNAFVAALDDPRPTVTLEWAKPQRIGRIELWFDADYDHALESVNLRHPENVSPFCVKHLRVLDGDGCVLAEVTDNHQPGRSIKLADAVTTGRLTIELLESHGRDCPAALMEVRCYP